MMSENEYKNYLIRELNKQNPEWIDGDIEIGRKHTADIVNHALGIAIEIKDEPKGSQDSLGKTNQQYGDHLRSAYRKFREYPEYRTVLLIKGVNSTIPEIVCYTINGLATFQEVGGQLVYSGEKNKYQPYIRCEIGCFLIVADKYYYCLNKYALSQRVLRKDEIEGILNYSLQWVV